MHQTRIALDLRLCAVVIPFIALIVFLPTVRYGWVGWDDEAYVTANRLVSQPAGLAGIWLSGESDQYYPLTFSTFWLEYRLWQRSPAGYHAVNVVLHAANALLVLFFLRALGASRRTACLVSLVFAVHPLQVQSVAWIAQRKNLLSGLFTLLSMLAWIRFRRCGQERWYLACFASFAAALLSKTAVLTMPIALAALDALVLKPPLRSTTRRIAPMLVLCAAALAVTSTFEQDFLKNSSIPPLGIRPLIAAAGIWFYTLKVFLPVDLVPIYPRWTVSFSTLFWWIPLLLLVVTGAVLWSKRRIVGGQILFGLVFYLAFLLPSSGLVAFGNMDLTFVSDHYVYIACVGLFLAIIAGSERVLVHFRVPAAVSGGAVAMWLTLLAAATLAYSPVFTDAESMWLRTIEGNPDCPTAHAGLGQYHGARSDWEKAAGFYTRAAALDPADCEIQAALGQAHVHLGEFSPAENHLRAAADSCPTLSQPLMDLAFIAEKTGRPREAIGFYGDALEIDPDNAAAHLRIGKVHLGFEERQAAAGHFRSAIRTDPHDPWAYLGLATSLRGLGDTGEAVRTLENGLEKAPDHISLLNMLARILATSAEEHIRDGRRALALATQANRISANQDCLALDTLAAAYAENGDFENAAATAEAAAAAAEKQGYHNTAHAIRENALGYQKGRALRESSTNLVLN